MGISKEYQIFESWQRRAENSPRNWKLVLDPQGRVEYSFMVNTLTKEVYFIGGNPKYPDKMYGTKSSLTSKLEIPIPEYGMRGGELSTEDVMDLDRLNHQIHRIGMQRPISLNQVMQINSDIVGIVQKMPAIVMPSFGETYVAGFSSFDDEIRRRVKKEVSPIERLYA